MDPEEVQNKFAQVLEMENRVWSYQKSLEAMDKVWEKNVAQLNASLIHIPFIKKTILDDMGIIKKEVPELLDENVRIVSSYNELLEETEQLKDTMLETIDQISRAILQDPDNYDPKLIAESQRYVAEMNKYKRNLNVLGDAK